MPPTALFGQTSNGTLKLNEKDLYIPLQFTIHTCICIYFGTQTAARQLDVHYLGCW